MAWENVIIGYKIQDFKKDDVIPTDAIFIRSFEHFIRMVGWVSHPHPHYETIYQYQVPIYKKKNEKRNENRKEKYRS